MRRRKFIAVFGGTTGAVVTGFLTAPQVRGQQETKVWRIGQVLFGTSATTGYISTAFKERLAALGDERVTLVTDHYVHPDPKSAEEEIAALSRTVDLLVIWSTIGGVAAKRVAPPVPVVFLSVGAPVDIGLVRSLSHPGGTMTGVSFEGSTETYAKRLQLLKEIVPTLARVSVLRPRGDANVRFAMASLEQSAPKLGVKLLPVDIASPDELDAAFVDMEKAGAQGLITIAGSLTFVADTRIVKLALIHRLPLCSPFRETVLHGGLVSLGPDFVAIARQGAAYVDKIIHGAKPAEIPVEQPDRYEVYVNTKTAAALGLTIPPSVLARADQVIE